MPNSQPPHKSTWFKREIRLDNLLILIGMIGSVIVTLAVGYAKYSVLEETVGRHDRQILQMQEVQEQTSEAIGKLTILVDERTKR